VNLDGEKDSRGKINVSSLVYYNVCVSVGLDYLIKKLPLS